MEKKKRTRNFFTLTQFLFEHSFFFYTLDFCVSVIRTSNIDFSSPHPTSSPYPSPRQPSHHFVVTCPAFAMIFTGPHEKPPPHLFFSSNPSPIVTEHHPLHPPTIQPVCILNLLKFISDHCKKTKRKWRLSIILNGWGSIRALHLCLSFVATTLQRGK